MIQDSIGWTTIDILFITGVLISTVKMSDILLRPHQQKWLQQKLETLTLRLSYTNIIQLFSKNLSSGFVNSAGLISLILAASFLRVMILDPITQAFEKQPVLFLSTAALSMFFLYRFKPVKQESYRYVNGYDIKAKGDEYPIQIFYKRISKVFFSFSLTVGVLFVIYTCAFYVLDRYYLKENIPILIFGMWYVAPIALDFIGLIVLFTLITLFVILIILIHFVLKLTQAVCWRIVEYNKGAWSAIILILTFILGIIEIVYKK